MTINVVYSKHAGKITKFNFMEICNLPESHMYIFNVSIATECQHKGVRGVIYTKYICRMPFIQNMLEND
jgi:hypothetical protein